MNGNQTELFVTLILYFFIR